jgi:ABC-type oligopeptide transport system substrate-binding subunit
MTRTLPRRTLLAAAPAALVSCRQDGRYFGTTGPPAGQRLVYANGDEPDTFDPGTYSGGTEMPLIPINFAVSSSLVKPYVRGWAWNALNEHHFKYVWIDNNWRVS